MTELLTELDTLRRAGDISISVVKGYINVQSARGVAKGKIRHDECLIDTIERIAERINRRYEAEYGSDWK